MEGRVRRAEQVVWETFGPETVLLDPDNGVYTRLNAAGSLLWTALEAPRTPDELAEALRARWALDPDQAAADVRAFLARLERGGAVEPA